jgi:hypothetical protein
MLPISLSTSNPLTTLIFNRLLLSGLKQIDSSLYSLAEKELGYHPYLLTKQGHLSSFSL